MKAKGKPNLNRSPDLMLS